MTYSMDTRTIILLLAIGSFLFFLLLLLDQFRKAPAQRIPYWAGAKFLQAVGSLVLFVRGPTSEFATIVSANTLLLLGCAYEAWAVCYLVGHRVGRLVHVPVALAIVAVCLATFCLPPPNRAAVVFAVHIVFLRPAGRGPAAAKPGRLPTALGVGGELSAGVPAVSGPRPVAGR